MSVTVEFYLARANECAREAADTSLDNVKDRCRRSEEAWRAMAARLDRAEQTRKALSDAKIAQREHRL